MKTLKNKSYSNESGEGLAIVIIVVVLIGLGAWWLFSTKHTAEKEGRAFANEAIQRITVQHDLAFLDAVIDRLQDVQIVDRKSVV